MTHARLGVYAKWTCKDCTANQYVGRLPCTDCTGYTTDPARILPRVLNAWGRPVTKAVAS
jgi:hypothetical protein